MVGSVKVGIRLPGELHRAVRVRALNDGVTLDELGRRWFEAYADGRLTEWSPEVVGAVRGLVAGEQPGGVSGGPVRGDAPEGGSSGVAAAAPAVSPRFRPDPKVKK